MTMMMAADELAAEIEQEQKHRGGSPHHQPCPQAHHASTQRVIMNCPLPDPQPGETYSPFTCPHTDAMSNLCGTVHNVASPEMLYCSSSNGEHFDRRAREVRQSPSVVEGMLLHANRRNSPRLTTSLLVPNAASL